MPPYVINVVLITLPGFDSMSWLFRFWTKSSTLPSSPTGHSSPPHHRHDDSGQFTAITTTENMNSKRNFIFATMPSPELDRSAPESMRIVTLRTAPDQFQAFLAHREAAQQLATLADTQNAQKRKIVTLRVSPDKFRAFIMSRRKKLVPKAPSALLLTHETYILLTETKNVTSLSSLASLKASVATKSQETSNITSAESTSSALSTSSPLVTFSSSSASPAMQEPSENQTSEKETEDDNSGRSHRSSFNFQVPTNVSSFPQTNDVDDDAEAIARWQHILANDIPGEILRTARRSLVLDLDMKRETTSLRYKIAAQNLKERMNRVTDALKTDTAPDSPSPSQYIDPFTQQQVHLVKPGSYKFSELPTTPKEMFQFRAGRVGSTNKKRVKLRSSDSDAPTYVIRQKHKVRLANQRLKLAKLDKENQDNPWNVPKESVNRVLHLRLSENDNFRPPLRSQPQPQPQSPPPAPSVPKVAKVARVPTVPLVPKIAETPKAAKPSEVVEAPKAVKTPKIAEAPKVPAAAKAAEVPKDTEPPRRSKRKRFRRPRGNPDYREAWEQYRDVKYTPPSPRKRKADEMRPYETGRHYPRAVIQPTTSGADREIRSLADLLDKSTIHDSGSPTSGVKTGARTGFDVPVVNNKPPTNANTGSGFWYNSLVASTEPTANANTGLGIWYDSLVPRTKPIAPPALESDFSDDLTEVDPAEVRDPEPWFDYHAIEQETDDTSESEPWFDYHAPTVPNDDNAPESEPWFDYHAHTVPDNDDSDGWQDMLAAMDETEISLRTTM